MNWIKAAQHSFITVRAIAKTIDLFQSKISLHMLIWCFNMERLLFYVNAPLVSNVILFGSACFFCSLIFWHHRCPSGHGNLKGIQSTTYSHILSTTRFAHSAHQSSVHFNSVLNSENSVSRGSNENDFNNVNSVQAVLARCCLHLWLYFSCCLMFASWQFVCKLRKYLWKQKLKCTLFEDGSPISRLVVCQLTSTNIARSIRPGHSCRRADQDFVPTIMPILRKLGSLTFGD